MSRLRRKIIENIHIAPEGETFTLASGRTSTYYVNLRAALLSGSDAISEAAREIVKIVPHDVRGLGGVPTGGLPLMGAVLAQYALMNGPGLVGFYTRLQANPHGRGVQVEGVIPQKDVPCALIEDTVTTGQSIIEHAKVAREAGINIRYALAVFDREEGAAANLMEEGILLLSVFRARDFNL